MPEFDLLHVLAIKVCLPNSSLIIANVYRRPVSIKPAIEDDLHKLVSLLQKFRSEKIILGDLNMDLCFPQESQKGLHLTNFFDTTDFTNVTHSPTRGPAILDVILTNQPNNFDVAKIVENSTSFSDHKLVG